MIHEIGAISVSPESTPLMKITAKYWESVHLNWVEAEFDCSLQKIEEGLEIARTSGVMVLTHPLLACGAYCAMNKGDLAAASRFIEGMKESLVPARLQDAGRMHYTIAWYSLVSGELRSALVHGETAATTVTGAGTPIPEMICRLGLAEVLNESGQRDRAEEELVRAGEMVARTRSQVILFRFLMLDAWIALSRGNEIRCLDSLHKGMMLGSEMELSDNLGWWRHDVMARLCVKALEHGIEVPYVQRLIRKRRLMPEEPPVDLEEWPWPLKVHTFGRFGLERDGVPIRFEGKVQQRPLELLKALIALGGRNVTEERLSDELWPDSSGDDARKALVVTLHRLRRLLGNEKYIHYSEGILTLNPQLCWVDAWAFTRIAGRTRDLIQDGAAATPAVVRSRERAIALYSDHFLATDDAPWIFSMRENLRSSMLQLVTSLARHWEEAGEWRKAAGIYLRGLETDDLVEEFYQRLMSCHQRLGDQGAIASLWKRCCTTLAFLGIKPSATTRAAYDAARGENR